MSKIIIKSTVFILLKDFLNVPISRGIFAL